MRLILAILVLGPLVGPIKNSVNYSNPIPAESAIGIPIAESKGEQQTLMGRTFCPIVARARATGMTDEQIIASALSKGVPQSIVLWAQKNCTTASGSHGKS